MYSRVIFIFLFCFCLIGCASNYVATSNVTNIRSQLDELEARNLLYEFIAGKKAGVGLCDAYTNRVEQPAKLLKMENFDLFYESYEAVSSGSSAQSSSSGTTVTTYYSKERRVYHINLKDIDKVRLVRNESYMHCPPNSTTIELTSWRGESIRVHVDSQDEDLFMAAITNIVPNANFLDGVGF